MTKKFTVPSKNSKVIPQLAVELNLPATRAGLAVAPGINVFLSVEAAGLTSR